MSLRRFIKLTLSIFSVAAISVVMVVCIGIGAFNVSAKSLATGVHGYIDASQLPAGEVGAATDTDTSADDTVLSTATDAVTININGNDKYLTMQHSINDLYNVCVLILLILTFWVIWNIVRTVYRIVTDFKHW